MAKKDFQYGGWNSYTLQCGRWLWDDMPLNSPKRPPYWNSTPGFDFDHVTAVDMSFCTSLRNFVQIGPPSAEKNDVMSIFKMADLSHLGFRGAIMGSLKSPCTTSYRSSIEIIALNCLVFSFFALWRQTDKQTDEQMDSIDALSRSRYRERRLNNMERRAVSLQQLNCLLTRWSNFASIATVKSRSLLVRNCCCCWPVANGTSKTSRIP